MEAALPLLIYGLPLAGVIWWYQRRRGAASARSTDIRDEVQAAGPVEPASLHPVIDPALCIGSGSCVSACPEGALGIVNGKAELINPSACIGHGACERMCPVDAIQLVFGSARRGMEIPKVHPDFQTDVPGLYVAGELGGMGLIRKATEQGVQAVQHIRKRLSAERDAAVDYDLIIVGAGPAGLGASLAAKAAGLKFLTLEQELTLGGSILHYPRAKIAMTAPMKLPLAGSFQFREISKESLLEFWHDIVRRHELPIRFGECMSEILPREKHLEVQAAGRSYRAASVLLSIGRRGTPRKLGVPGEDQPHVVYRLQEPEQYAGQNVLVVGGGDSAVEAAMALVDGGARSVALSYRSPAFSRIKPKNRQRLDDYLARKRLEVLLSSEVAEIGRGRVLLSTESGERSLACEQVIVCAGGELPTRLLKATGVSIESHYGEWERRRKLF